MPNELKITDLDDVDAGGEPVWLIDRLLPASGLSVICGAPKSGKTFLVLDAVLHIAANWQWAGRQVLPGSVIYFCGESSSGFKRRVLALRDHHGLKGQGVPFGLVPAAPNLGNAEGDAEEIIKTVRAWIGSARPPLRAVVIDTLARSMQGGDENSAQDMTTFVDNCERVARDLNCIVIVVHHTGKNDASTTRGSTVLPAAADVVWLVKKGKSVREVVIASMRDGEEGTRWGFTLEPGRVEQQNAASGVVVRILNPPAAAQQPPVQRSKTLSQKQAELLDLVKSSLNESSERVTCEPGAPDGAMAISRRVLQNRLKQQGKWDRSRSDGHNRSEFGRDLNALASCNLIGVTRTHVWLIDLK